MGNRVREFDISRRIIASTTTDSWRNAPHCGTYFEADVTRLMEALRSYNSGRPDDERISINSAMLKIIIEALKASPVLNGHVSYCHSLVKGRITLMDHIDISTPIVYGDGKMMTVTLPHMEDRSVREIQAMMNGYRKRMEQTDMEAVMYLAGLSDTMEGLMHGRVLKAAGRLIGSGLGKGRVRVSPGRMIESIRAGKAGTALSPEDIRQGSITVSSIGPLYRKWKGFCTMLQVVPPQICAIAVGTLRKIPDVEDDRIVIKQIIPVTAATDHRAADFSDMVPFMERMDEMLASDEQIDLLFRP